MYELRTCESVRENLWENLLENIKKGLKQAYDEFVKTRSPCAILSRLPIRLQEKLHIILVMLVATVQVEQLFTCIKKILGDWHLRVNLELGHPNKLFHFLSPDQPTFFKVPFKENITDPHFWKFQ